MKYIFSSMLSVLCLAAFTQCSDDASVMENPISISKEGDLVKVTMKSTQKLDYNLGLFGDEGGASITLQPASFASSFMERKNYIEMIYHYTPVKNFTGKVSAELISNRDWNFETRQHEEILITTIEITVTQ